MRSQISEPEGTNKRRERFDECEMSQSTQPSTSDVTIRLEVVVEVGVEFRVDDEVCHY